MPIVNERGDFDERVSVRVVGVGSCGMRAMEAMIDDGLEDVELIAIDTDVYVLEVSSASTKVLLSARSANGVRAIGIPDVAREAAVAEVSRLRSVLAGSQFVLVVAGMGGGAGTGAAPVVARVAKELGALTVAVVTTPFPFEGGDRIQVANTGLLAFRAATDTTFVLGGEGLLATSDAGIAPDDLFRHAAATAAVAVRGLVDPVLQHGMICFEFDDFKIVLPKSGPARVGIASGKRIEGLIAAAESAMVSPLFGGLDIARAEGIFIAFHGGPEVLLRWVAEAVRAIERACREDVDVLFTLTTMPDWKDAARITLFATGMPTDAAGSP